MADLAELADLVEGLRAAAHKARDEGNVSLAEALEVTRFEVYQRYLDELAASSGLPRRAKPTEPSIVDQQAKISHVL